MDGFDDDLERSEVNEEKNEGSEQNGLAERLFRGEGGGGGRLEPGCSTNINE